MRDVGGGGGGQGETGGVGIWWKLVSGTGGRAQPVQHFIFLFCCSSY